MSHSIETKKLEIDSLQKDIANYFLVYFKTTIISSSDYDKLITYLRENLDIFTDIKSKIENHDLSNSEKIAAIFVALKNNYNVIESELLRRITINLDFLQQRRAEPFEPFQIDLFVFGDIVKYLKDAFDWYTFIFYAYNKLSTHQIQNEKTEFRVSYLTNWAYFKNSIRDSSDPTFNLILEKPQLSDHEEKSLNEMISVCFQNPTEEYFENTNELIFKGNYIQISDIAAKIENQTNQTVIIFALHTVCINQSLELQGKMLKLAIIARKIICLGNQTFNLNGESAWQYMDQTSKTGHGLQGLSGGAAGIFFCVSDKFENIKGLTITVNGGDGGYGQNGLAGVNGDDGITPNLVREDKHRTLFSMLLEGSGVKDLKTGVKDNGFMKLKGSPITEAGVVYEIFDFDNKTLYFGTCGTNGTNGGNGGTGGEGGYGGEVTVVTLSDNGIVETMPVCWSKVGQNGKDGNGGKGARGGIGGKNGHDVLVVEKLMIKNIDSFIDKGYAENGSNGIDGHNRTHLNPNTKIKFDSIPNILIKFKRFLLNEKSPLNYSAIMEFYNKINENTALNDPSMSSSLDFVNEFKDLEQIFMQSADHSYWPIIFGSFQLRIEIKLGATIVIDNQYSILKGLRLLTLTILNYIENKILAPLIVKPKEYLKTMLNNVSELRDGNKIQAIIKHQDSYTRTLNQNISEVKHFVELMQIQVPNIQLDIDKIFQNFKNKISEIIENLNGELEKLQNNREATEFNLTISRVFGLIKIVVSLTNFVGLISIIEKVESQSKKPLQTIDSAFLEKNGKILTKELFNELKNYHFDSNLSNCLKNLEGCIQKDLSDNIPYDMIIDKITVFLAEQKKSIDESDISGEKKEHEVNTANFYLSLSRLVINWYKMDHQSDILLQINNCINEVNKKKNQLSIFEFYFGNLLRPIVSNTIDKLDKCTRTLATASASKLFFSKREIRDVCEKAKKKIISQTQGFKICSELVHKMDQFAELLETILTYFEHMDGHRNHANFAKFIAEIHLADTTNLNDQYSVALFYLKQMNSKYNVLEQLCQAESAVKQWLFPFAYIYLDNLIDDSVEISEGQDSTNHFLNTICKKLGKMIDITGKDECTVNNERDRNIIRLTEDHLFYCFPCEGNNRSLIKNILKGNEVLIKTIQNGPSTYDGLKFSEIKLLLKIKNKNKIDEPELGVCLKKFEISMTHMGPSYYQFNEKVWTINNSPLEIVHIFDGNRKNQVYEKTKEGNPMLSPFTTWKIQLRSAEKGANDPFKILDKFHDNIELEFVGKGSYIRSGCKISDKDIERYYHLHN
jgi:hypothetical protein